MFCIVLQRSPKLEFKTGERERNCNNQKLQERIKVYSREMFQRGKIFILLSKNSLEVLSWCSSSKSWEHCQFVQLSFLLWIIAANHLHIWMMDACRWLSNKHPGNSLNNLVMKHFLYHWGWLRSSSFLTSGSRNDQAVAFFQWIQPDGPFRPLCCQKLHSIKGGCGQQCAVRSCQCEWLVTVCHWSTHFNGNT